MKWIAMLYDFMFYQMDLSGEHFRSRYSSTFVFFEVFKVSCLAERHRRATVAGG